MDGWMDRQRKSMESVVALDLTDFHYMNTNS